MQNEYLTTNTVYHKPELHPQSDDFLGSGLPKLLGGLTLTEFPIDGLLNGPLFRLRHSLSEALPQTIINRIMLQLEETT